MAALLTVKEAQARILSSFKTVDTESVSLVQSAGRVLAEDISAPADLPPFNNSSMDGYAVLAVDVSAASPANPITLKVVADIPAGTQVDTLIRSGQAARIMTGAPLPPGADAVVPVEDTLLSGGRTDFHGVNPETIAIARPAGAGANIRSRGMDIRQGQVLLNKGRKLKPQDVGLLASIGKSTIRVYRKPRIALFSSGDELVQPGSPLGPGQIYDSNQFVLAAILEREGAQVIRLGVSPDDPEHISAYLQRAVEEKVDLIVSSAGVSVGAYDFVRQVIERHGSLDFWRVNMRPGKPLAFGAFSGIPFIGLPGNPVSAFVGCLIFVLPALLALSGNTQPAPRREKARLSHAIESDGRESYLRAWVNDEGGQLVASLTEHQGSGNLYSLVRANALLIVPSGVKSLPSDSEVDVWFFQSD